MNSKTPTEVRKDFYQILKNVNKEHKPLYIIGKNNESNAVIIGLEDWRSIEETIRFETTSNNASSKKLRKG